MKNTTAKILWHISTERPALKRWLPACCASDVGLKVCNRCATHTHVAVGGALLKRSWKHISAHWAATGELLGPAAEYLRRFWWIVETDPWISQGGLYIPWRHHSWVDTDFFPWRLTLADFTPEGTGSGYHLVSVTRGAVEPHMGRNGVAPRYSMRWRWEYHLAWLACMTQVEEPLQWCKGPHMGETLVNSRRS